jgi:GNAT superfamily N-acetyltransferase
MSLHDRALSPFGELRVEVAGAQLSYAHRVNTRNMSPDQVLRASAEWISIWFPAHSVHTDLGWLEYYLLDATATVMRVRPGDMKAAELVSKVLAELWHQGATQVHWQTGPRYSLAGVDQVLAGLGASVHETIDICGYSLDHAFPVDSLSQGASARPVLTPDDVAQYERTSARAWGYPPPSEEDIDRAVAGSTAGYFIGYWNGTPAGAGGYTLVGDVARFWGTAVVPEFRGRGIYRALVHARMTHARNRGAKLAIVHARPTSSPILQRLGFAVYGQRKVWSIPR